MCCTSRIALLLLALWPASLLAAPQGPPGALTRTPGPHPRTLLLPGQRQAIQSRLGREPYLTLFKRTAAWAARAGAPSDHTLNQVQRTANIARAAAFLHYLDRTVGAGGAPAAFADANARQAMGRKAASYLLAMKITSRAKGALGYIKDIHTAQELHMWAETLDLLLGVTPSVFTAAERARAAQNLADLAADFYGDFTADPNYLLTRSLINNHRTKSAGALGLAALALHGERFEARATDGRYDPARWLDFALRYADLCGRDILTDADHGYQEGPAYLAYGHLDLLSFLWAWHNYTGGAAAQVDWSPGVVPYYRFHASGPVVVPNLWRSPWLEGQLRWAASLALPDGTMPGYDDNSPGGRPFFFGALVQPGVASAGFFRWTWRRAGYPSSGSVDQAPFLLSTFDDRVEETPPAAAGVARSSAMPHAGQVIMRSGWGADDTHVMVLAEHGKAAGWARTRWGDQVDGAAGHEHPDPGAFSLTAHGERLAIDSGYMGWDQHSLVNDAHNHNILLVDGKGPQIYRLVIPETDVELGKVTLKRPEQEGGWAPALDGMAYLTASDMSSPGVNLAEVVTTYSVNVPRTEIRRRAVFLASRYLVLLDRAVTPHSGPGMSTAIHSYTFQLHGNGGGTSGGTFARVPGGGLWSRPAARLRATLSAGRPLALNTRLAVHDPGNRKPHTHVALDGTVRARRGEPVELLALLAPERVADSAGRDAVTTCRPGPCLRWTAPDISCTAWSGARREVRGAVGGAALLQAGGGAFCRSGRHLSGLFDEVGKAGGPMLTGRFALDAAGRAAAYQLKIHRAGAGAPVATLDLPAVVGREPAGACKYSTTGRGATEQRWQVQAPAPGTLVTAPRLTLPVASVVSPALLEGRPALFRLGERVKLSSAASCGAGPTLSRAWRITRRPELSRLELPAASASAIEQSLAPDLPGVYALSLTVTGPGAGQGRATYTFEVEGEPPWPDGTDAGPPRDAGADAASATPAPVAGGGCDGCAAGGPAPAGAPALLLALLLAACRRRRI